MTFLTGLALQRRSVTILVIILVLVAGVVTYNRLERELFPEIEFPNMTIITAYPNANPETVERAVTEPIEEAIEGMSGLKEIQSVSSENLSLIIATFEFGEDMKEAERTIEANINGIRFPADVEDPVVSRINNNTFPVLQLSVSGDRDIPSLQRLLDDTIIPRIERLNGVFRVDVLGKVDEQVTVTVDTDKLEDLGLSMLQVSDAIASNNVSFPGGDVDRSGVTFAIRTTHELTSLEQIRNLTVGFESPEAPRPGRLPNQQGQRPILLSDVAEVELSTDEATSISRTNSKPSLNVLVIKDPDANTVEVTRQVLEQLEGLDGLPADVEILELSNDGPEVEKQLSNLLREGLLGFIFAIAAVFVFLLNTRPSLLRGLTLALRPTIIIGISIPMSVLTGVMLMGLAGLSLNFMSLAGLAIAVGRVVDDSIVVLENTYRHIQRGEERFTAAIIATREVGAAIVSSTLTTVVVFVPLAFIHGLVGEFFTPFAMSVSFALIASTLVALTAVPVLGSMLLRRGDFPDEDSDSGNIAERHTFLQRIYRPILTWSLSHRIATLLIAVAATGSSLLLLLVIPVTFFPAGTPQFLTVDVELDTGTSVGSTFAEVVQVERVLERFREEGLVEVYQVGIGSGSNQFGPMGGGGGMHVAGFFVKLAEDVPGDITDRIRAAIPASEAATVTVAEISNGPPTEGVEINIIGNNFNNIAAVARELEAELQTVQGIINVSSDVNEARDEVTINVDPRRAAEFGLTATEVGQQVNQFVVGRAVTEVDLGQVTMDVVVRGRPDHVDDMEKLKALDIQGPLGTVKLGALSEIAIEQGPIAINRFDLERSAAITGTIVSEDTQAVGRQVQRKIDALQLPPGVEVRSGGIFEQINEGFQDIFTAMIIGIVLVYLVMVASLGSLRDPFIIVLSLPLAIVGALVALAVTDRTLSLSALMGLLLLIGVVVTNAIVMLTFVEQLRQQGRGVYEALVEGGLVRLRPILMTAFTTTFALFPLAVSSDNDSGIIGAELATVVIGGLISSTFLTLVFVPVIYTFMHVTIPGMIASLVRLLTPRSSRPQDEVALGD